LNGGGTLKSNPSNSFFDVSFQLPVESFKVVLPDGNQVSNPPTACSVATTATPNDSMLCTPAMPLPASTHANGSFMAAGPISAGTAQLFARRPDVSFFEGPFTLIGP
jgi:hypothetical protein